MAAGANRSTSNSACFSHFRSLSPALARSARIYETDGPTALVQLRNRRARRVAIGAEHTAVAGFWLEPRAAPVLGAHLVGPHVDEVVNLFGLAIRHELTGHAWEARHYENWGNFQMPFFGEN